MAEVVLKIEDCDGDKIRFDNYSDHTRKIVASVDVKTTDSDEGWRTVYLHEDVTEDVISFLIRRQGDYQQEKAKRDRRVGRFDQGGFVDAGVGQRIG